MVPRFYPRHLRKKRQRIIIAVSVLTFLLTLGLGIWFYRYWTSQPHLQIYTNESLGVRLRYPSNFKETKLTKKAREAGYVFEIKRENPPALFSLRFEEGLGPLKILGGSVFEALVTEVNRRYPERFPNYQKENYEEFVLANEKAAQFDFTYTGADGKTRVRQRFVVVVKDSTAYYLSFQAPKKEFFKSEKDFARIIESFEFL